MEVTLKTDQCLDERLLTSAYTFLQHFSLWALSCHSLRDHLTATTRTECEFAAAAPWSALIAESIGCDNWLV